MTSVMEEAATENDKWWNKKKKKQTKITSVIEEEATENDIKGTLAQEQLTRNIPYVVEAKATENDMWCKKQLKLTSVMEDTESTENEICDGRRRNNWNLHQ